MSSTDLVRAHVIAHGRVQGVFYRDTVRRAAEAHGVSGAAVNLRDGTVECIFEGPRDAVEQVVGLARAGSSASDVSMLDIEWVEPTGIVGFTTG